VSPLDTALDALAEAVADRVVAKLSAGQHSGFVDQTASPLGRRRHIAAARRLVAEGKAGAAIVGRRHLLTREALDAELAALKPRSRTKAQPIDQLGALREKYGLARAG
jgi:hypothetical protein